MRKRSAGLRGWDPKGSVCSLVMSDHPDEVFLSGETDRQTGFITVTKGASGEMQLRLRGCGGGLDGW